MMRDYFDEIEQTLMDICEEYGEMLEAYDAAFAEEDGGQYGLTAFLQDMEGIKEFHTDPEIQEITGELQEMVEPQYHGTFPQAMLNENYEAAAIMTDYGVDELEKAFEPYVETVREKREEYGVEASETASPEALERMEQDFDVLDNIIESLGLDEH